jgi:hypothetical protein
MVAPALKESVGTSRGLVREAESGKTTVRPWFRLLFIFIDPAIKHREASTTKIL